MKRNTIVFILTIILTATYAFSEDKPLIVFDKTAFNFGKIQKKTTVKHTFIFKNKGKATLLIDRVMRGCACTTVSISSREIPAEGEGRLEIELNTDYSEGKIEKKFFVYSNDPDHAMIELTVKADVFIPGN